MGRGECNGITTKATRLHQTYLRAVNSKNVFIASKNKKNSKKLWPIDVGLVEKLTISNALKRVMQLSVAARYSK
jgi:hypothetical protein